MSESKRTEVWIELLPTDKGGRSSPIFIVGYRPHFRVRDGNGEYLGVQFIDGPDGAVRPGQDTFATVRFAYEPEVDYSALVVGAEFDIMEGGKVVGAGKVTREFFGLN
ncbi:MAG TPA: hypothetical protein VL175_20270 [Pirellulales bacterium]|jgi:translation elongation factor EF-Tu-like GTPase|nr:hypothetical protein [Pirellulales bacterium]